LLKSWSSNRTRSIVKSPKLYLADTGLLCALLNIRSEEALRQSPARGEVWETFVFAQLRDGNVAQDGRAPTSSGATEPVVDFVVGAGRADVGQIRKKIKTHPDAGLHALRHTFLTEAGEYTDPFTLQYVAGHDNIKTTMCYVHPREAAVHKLFARLADLRPEERIACTESVQNPVQLEIPLADEIAKLLIASNLQSAEVVELADTPS
jgi:hypothetical protein